MYVDPLLLFSSGLFDHLIFYACFASMYHFETLIFNVF